jgi:hypothetical protein
MSRIDPTRSITLRSRGRALVNRKVFGLQRGLMQAIVEQDVTGLRSRGPSLPGNIIAWVDPPANKLSRSDMLLRKLVGDELSHPPDWLNGLMRTSIVYGVRQAEKEIKVGLNHIDTKPLSEMHGHAAAAEVLGIAQETERRLIRHAGHAIESKQTPEVMMRDVRTTLEKVTRLRLHMLVNNSVVRAVNAGKLLSYKDQGINLVGINPEWLPYRGVRDTKQRKRFVDLGQTQSTKRKPAAQDIYEVLVSVETAGDEFVCDDCNDLAAGGPYDVDRASSLLPVHANCRCSVVAFDDKRFAAIEEQLEELEALGLR